MVHFAKKGQWMDGNGCVPWMKRASLYTSGVVGSKAIYMGYKKHKLCAK